MSGNPDYSTVLKAVTAWSPQERASLAHALIDTLKPSETARAPRIKLEELVGIARGSGPAPSDAQVGQWVEEARLEKHG